MLDMRYCDEAILKEEWFYSSINIINQYINIDQYHKDGRTQNVVDWSDFMSMQ